MEPIAVGPEPAAPVVQGAPMTVIGSAPETACVPALPTRLNGIVRFAAAAEQGPKMQTFAVPRSSIAPPNGSPPNEPAALRASTMTPSTGNDSASLYG